MKSNKTKSAMTALVIAAMLCSAAMPIRAAEAQWVNNNGTWSYVKEDGSIAKGWIKDGDCWYAFDDNGAMRTGWIASNEHWYFMGESGVMQADAWVEDSGARYYIKGTGVMAKDYVKDGYELTEDGKAIPLAESKSVVLTDPEAIEGEVIEGNLYVDVTTAKALELKGVTVKGKLVIIGDNKTAGKLTITDSKIEAISTQTRNTEVVLSGETEVNTIVLEETAAVTPDKNFKGEVEKIEVQSTTKGEIVIEVPAQEVSTRTYASVDIQAPVESLEVKTDTQIKVNADVKNVVVTESAKDTAIEVSKGSTVGTLTADAPVSIDGKGTVNKVEANVDGVEAGKDTVIKDVETGKDVEQAPEVNKPSTGGSSGGSSTSSYTVKYAVDGSISFDVPAAVTVTSGSTITEPAKPADAPEGYSYKWVTSDGKPFDFSSKIRNSMTLTLILTNNDFAGGNGSESFPYLVTNADQFYALENLTNSSKTYHFKQLNDFTLDRSITTHYDLSYDGGGHKIIACEKKGILNLFVGLVPYEEAESTTGAIEVFNVELVSNKTVGLSIISDPFYIDEINLHDIKCSVDGDILNIDIPNYAFLITGTIYDYRETWTAPQKITINNCDIVGSVVTGSTNAAGFVGAYYPYDNDGTIPNYEKSPLLKISNSTFNGDITATSFAGLIYGNPTYYQYFKKGTDKYDESKINELIIVDNVVFNGKVTANYANLFATSETQNPIWNDTYKNEIKGSYDLINRTNQIASDEVKVYLPTDGEDFTFTTDNANNYTYQLVFSVNEIVISTGGGTEEGKLVSNGRKIFLDVSKAENASTLTEVKVVKAIDSTRLNDLGLEAPSSYDKYCENWPVAIVVKDNTVYIIFEKNDTFESVDSSVVTSLYAYDGNALVGTKNIK